MMCLFFRVPHWLLVFFVIYIHLNQLQGVDSSIVHLGFSQQLMDHIWVLNQKYGKTPQIIHFNRVFHEINHPFWGVFPPLFLVQHPYVLHANKWMTRWNRGKTSKPSRHERHGFKGPWKLLRCPTSTSWRNLPCSRQRTSHRAQVVFRPLKTMSYPILSLPCCQQKYWDQRICENQMWRKVSWRTLAGFLGSFLQGIFLKNQHDMFETILLCCWSSLPLSKFRQPSTFQLGHHLWLGEKKCQHLLFLEYSIRKSGRPQIPNWLLSCFGSQLLP